MGLQAKHQIMDLVIRMQTGYVVRNSFAHGGKLDIRVKSFVLDWNGRQIALDNHGEQLMGRCN